jgi:hypothetical protein
MSDVHLDGTDAPGTAADGSRLVHVDCERCGSRLEVRVPLAFQLAGREATVRCGACETLLQVSVPPPSPQRGAPPSPADSHAMHAAAASFLRQHPVEDDARSPSDSASPGSRAHERQKIAEQQTSATHMQLAQWHMNMAQRHSPGPMGSLDTDAFFQYAPPPSQTHDRRGDAGPSNDHVATLLRQAAHDFWSRENVDGDGDLKFHGHKKKIQKRERKPREPSSYNVFIRDSIPKLKAEDPGLNHRDAFKLAAKNWAHSPLNARSASFRPDQCPPVSGAGLDDVNRDRNLIMAKLHPHLVRCREEDVEEETRGDTAPRYEVSGGRFGQQFLSQGEGVGASSERQTLRESDHGTGDALAAATAAVEHVVSIALDSLSKTGKEMHTACGFSSDKSTCDDAHLWHRAPARGGEDE